MARLRSPGRPEDRPDLGAGDALRVGRAMRHAVLAGRRDRAQVRRRARELATALDFASVEAMEAWRRRHMAARRDRDRITDAVERGEHLEATAQLYAFESVEAMAAWAAGD